VVDCGSLQAAGDPAGVRDCGRGRVTATRRKLDLPDFGGAVPDGDEIFDEAPRTRSHRRNLQPYEPVAKALDFQVKRRKMMIDHSGGEMARSA